MPRKHTSDTCRLRIADMLRVPVLWPRLLGLIGKLLPCWACQLALLRLLKYAPPHPPRSSSDVLGTGLAVTVSLLALPPGILAVFKKIGVPSDLQGRGL